MKTSRLLRSNGENTGTLVMVGNGAVNKGWVPADEVFKRLIDADDVSAELKAIRNSLKDKSAYMALLSYKFRIGRLELFLQIKKAGGLEHWSREHPKQIENFLYVRNELAKEYLARSRDGTLALRLKIEDQKFFSLNDRFITSNWDTLLWDTPSIKNILYAHGRCEHEESMVFPSELNIDDFPFDPCVITDCKKMEETKKFPLPGEHDFLFRTFRWNFLSELTMAHEVTRDWLSSAKRLVVWGFGLNSYDAELLAQIATHVDEKNLEELVILNPNEEDRKKTIAVIGPKRAKITEIDPAAH